MQKFQSRIYLRMMNLAPKILFLELENTHKGLKSTLANLLSQNPSFFPSGGSSPRWGSSRVARPPSLGWAWPGQGRARPCYQKKKGKKEKKREREGKGEER